MQQVGLPQTSRHDVVQYLHQVTCILPAGPDIDTRAWSVRQMSAITQCTQALDKTSLKHELATWAQAATRTTSRLVQRLLGAKHGKLSTECLAVQASACMA